MGKYFGTDGTAVLGLGDIGPEAGMPVMEGKCALFKAFADVDAFPLCIRSKDVDEIVRTVFLLSGSFGGINLEDISAPVAMKSSADSRRFATFPCSTTTSTVPPSWWRRLSSTPSRWWARRSAPSVWSSTARGRRGSPSGSISSTWG